MKRALGIVRLSTRRQRAGDRVSGPEQADRIRAWCSTNDYEVVEVLHETVSRADELDPLQREGRPLFWSAWDRLVAGEVDALVFWEPTRFCAGLDGVDFSYWLRKSLQHGDGIRFTENEPPREGRYATVVSAVTGSQASEDYKSLIENMKVGREGHARRGEFAGGALPFWLRWIAPVKKEGGGVITSGKFELREEGVKTVRRILALYNEGQGSEQIANILTRDHVPPPSAVSAQWKKNRARTHWNGASVLNILRNPVLYGVHHFGGKKPRKNPKTRLVNPIIVPVPALISKDEFDAIQDRMRHNRNYAGPRTRMGWPLQGLIWSEACGHLYRCKPDGNTQRRVYRCLGRLARRHRGDGTLCNCPPLPANEIEKQVAQALRHLLKDPDARRQAVADYIADLEGRQAALQARLVPCEEEIARLQGMIDEFTVDLRRGRLSPERYEQEVKALEKQRDAARNRRSDLGTIERELRQVEESLDGIRAAIDEGLLHVTVVSPHDVITWLDDDDPDSDLELREEAMADLIQRLRLRIVVRTDGQAEIRGFMEPTPVGSAADRRRAGASPTCRPSRSRCGS